MRLPLVLGMFLLCSSALSSELKFQFKNPSFSGEGFSAHVLTLENQEHSRRDAIRKKKESDARMRLLEEQNTPINQFLSQFQSKIFSKIASDLVEKLFGENPQDAGVIDIGDSSIAYVRNGNNVTLTITNSDGSQTSITVPLGAFGF